MWITVCLVGQFEWILPKVWTPAVFGCTHIFESCWLVTAVVMYAFVEEPSRTHCDSSVQSLSWMGKAPDGQPESGTAWRLSENSYYDEGWLASGNSRGVVGVTMTGCRSTQNSSSDLPLRTNFNLRGHRSEVSIATVNCDFVAWQILV